MLDQFSQLKNLLNYNLFLLLIKEKKGMYHLTGQAVEDPSAKLQGLFLLPYPLFSCPLVSLPTSFLFTH